MGYITWDYFTIAPAKTTGYFERFAKSLVSRGLTENVSIASAGQRLLADYNRRRPVNLQQSMDITVANLSRLTETTGSILIDGGNAYALPFADRIMNMPLSGSSYTAADESVPFMQLVLHGYVSYAGGAANMAGDPWTAMLRNAEYGANPSFTVAAEHTEELKESVYSFYYAVNYETWRDEIIRSYLAFNEAYKGLEGVAMTRHDKLAPGLYRTQYANGVSILVNYNEEAAEAGIGRRTVTVAGRSFIRIEGEDR
jgi:hypothetical protein